MELIAFRTSACSHCLFFHEIESSDLTILWSALFFHFFRFRHIFVAKHSKLLVGRSLVRMGGPIPIRLLNPMSYARQVYKNTLAALCEPVDGDQVDGELLLRQTETDVRLA